MNELAIVLYTVTLIVLSCVYLLKRYKIKKGNGVSQIVLKYKKFLFLTAVLVIGILGIEIYYMQQRGVVQLPLLLRWSTLIWGLYLLAKIDFHEKKIPNKIVLILLVVRVSYLLYEAWNNREYLNMVMIPPLLGAFIGGGIMMIAMLISRKGVGMGDVKLFIVIGAYVGSTQVISTMFYTFFVSAIAGIVLLMTKRAHLNDSIPMAPFAFIGVVTEYILLMLGG